MKSLVTVVMSVYNGERYLKKSINSIVCQSYKDFEFIIIDDCSSDNTLKIIESFNDPRIVIVRNNENIGLSASLNKGIRLSSGKYIARQDDDDISERGRLQKQLDFMEKSKDVDAVFCRFDLFDRLGEISGSESKYYDSKDILRALQNREDPLAHGAAMIRKESLTKVGYYDERFVYGQDYELWNKILKSGQKISMINYLGYHHRVSFSSMKKKWQNKFSKLVDNSNYKCIDNLYKKAMTAKGDHNQLVIFKFFDLCHTFYFHIKLRLKFFLNMVL